MNWLQHQLGLMPKPDVILHIGAGLCGELPEYQRIRPRHIVLVEPNPETVTELRAHAAAWDNVTVLHAAVTAQGSSASLRLFNFPELDGLHEPVGLYPLLPGLRPVGRAEVAGLSVSQLLQQAAIHRKGHNWLVLEAPGQEREIVQALAEEDRLQHFSRVIVRAGAESFYEDPDTGMPGLLTQLEAHGYLPEAKPDTSDSDWPRVHVKFQPMVLEVRRVTAQVEQAHRETTKAQETARDRQAQLEKTVAERDEHAKRAKELTEARTSLEKQLQDAKANLEARTKERDEHAQRAKGLTEARTSLEKQLQDAKATLDAQHAEQAQLKARRDELKEQLSKAESAANEKQAELKRLQAKISTLENEAATLRQKNNTLEQGHKKLEENYRKKEALLDEEFLKAETQIELIKDLVFRVNSA